MMECYKKNFLRLLAFLALHFPPLVFGNEIVSFEKTERTVHHSLTKQMNQSRVF